MANRKGTELLLPPVPDHHRLTKALGIRYNSTKKVSYRDLDEFPSGKATISGY
jgi:hypothetical protein